MDAAVGDRGVAASDPSWSRRAGSSRSRRGRGRRRSGCRGSPRCPEPSVPRPFFPVEPRAPNGTAVTCPPIPNKVPTVTFSPGCRRGRRPRRRRRRGRPRSAGRRRCRGGPPRPAACGFDQWRPSFEVLNIRLAIVVFVVAFHHPGGDQLTVGGLGELIFGAAAEDRREHAGCSGPERWPSTSFTTTALGRSAGEWARARRVVGEPGAVRARGQRRIDAGELRRRPVRRVVDVALALVLADEHVLEVVPGDERAVAVGDDLAPGQEVVFSRARGRPARPPARRPPPAPPGRTRARGSSRRRSVRRSSRRCRCSTGCRR